MSTKNIQPEKITKPIQLLGAWLLGLLLMNSAFLTAASQISKPDWAAGALVIAAMANVPLFLISIFLLQTKFRPEMQEDSYYSKHLERKYNELKTKKNSNEKVEDDEKEAKATAELITKELNSTPQDKKEEKIESILRVRDIARIKNRIGNSRALSELYLYPEHWKHFANEWEDSESFNNDIKELFFYKVIKGSIESPKLTPLGKEIASKLEKEGQLWNQLQKRIKKSEN